MTIKTKEITPRLAVQFSTRAFAIGFTVEFDQYLFILIGPFTILWRYK